MKRGVMAVQRQLEREASHRLRTRSTRLLAWGLGLVGSLMFAVVLRGTGHGEAPPLSPATPSERKTQEPLMPIPLRGAEDPQHVELGERLFHDPQLSHDNRQSCVTCHPLDRGGMDGRPWALALDGQVRLRNTPTIFNVGLNFWFNWDGRTHTLESHADQLLRNPAVMNTTWPELHDKLARDATYISAFRAAYDDGLTWNNVIAALVSFERSLTTPHSRFDMYLHGEQQALTVNEQQGYSHFKAYGCIACHQGVNIGGNMFAKFGIFHPPDGSRAEAGDSGRFMVTPRLQNLQVFRVPSLRNVAATAPYFHDGRAATLAAAVDTMAQVQLGKTLTPEEIDLLVQFLHTLTGEYRGAPVRVRAPGVD